MSNKEICKFILKKCYLNVQKCNLNEPETKEYLLPYLHKLENCGFEIIPNGKNPANGYFEIDQLDKSDLLYDLTNDVEKVYTTKYPKIGNYIITFKDFDYIYKVLIEDCLSDLSEFIDYLRREVFNFEKEIRINY